MPGRLKSKYEFAILKGGGGYFLSIRVKVSQINSLKKKIAGLNTNVPDAQFLRDSNLCLIVFLSI